MTTMTDPITIAPTAQLHAINHRALTRNFNRALDPEFMDTLDPEGIHVLVFSMQHDHKAGVRVAPHMRTMWHVKVQGSDDPVTVSLDMSMVDFMALPKVVRDSDGEWHLAN